MATQADTGGEIEYPEGKPDDVDESEEAIDIDEVAANRLANNLVDELGRWTGRIATGALMVTILIAAATYLLARFTGLVSLGDLLALPIAAVIAALIGITLGALLLEQSVKRTAGDLGLDLERQILEDEPIVLEPPERKKPRTRVGIIVKLWRERRYRDKKKKLLGKGYVEWYLIDETFPAPRFVKPERRAAGIPEYERDGERYLFPRDGAVSSEQNGFWVFVHQKGDADPLNLKEPKDHVIPADAVDEWANMRVASSPLGLLERFDLTPRKIMRYGIIGIIAYAIIREMLKNGITAGFILPGVFV